MAPPKIMERTAATSGGWIALRGCKTIILSAL